MLFYYLVFFHFLNIKVRKVFGCWHLNHHVLFCFQLFCSHHHISLDIFTLFNFHKILKWWFDHPNEMIVEKNVDWSLRCKRTIRKSNSVYKTEILWGKMSFDHWKKWSSWKYTASNWSYMLKKNAMKLMSWNCVSKFGINIFLKMWFNQTNEIIIKKSEVK